MRVYAETNFILELVLEQEDHSACEGILALAEQTKIALALPAFSLAEASATLARKHAARSRSLSDGEAGRELLQLRRSATFSDRTKIVQDSIQTLFLQSLQQERDNLRDLNTRLLRVATILPLSAGVIEQVEKSPFSDLTVPDAIVLFSILADPLLGRDQACFLSRDLAAFDDPDIRRDLQGRQCKFFRSFGDGGRYIQNQIAPSPK